MEIYQGIKPTKYLPFGNQKLKGRERQSKKTICEEILQRALWTEPAVGGGGGPGVFTVAGALCSAQSPQGKGQGLAKAWRGEGVNQVWSIPDTGRSTYRDPEVEASRDGQRTAKGCPGMSKGEEEEVTSEKDQ